MLYYAMFFQLQIGIIGGTGFNDPHLFEERTEKSVNTVFGEVCKNLCGSVFSVFGL